MNKIVFENIAGNGIAISSPSLKALENESIEENAKRTVMQNFGEERPFYIMDESEIPHSGNWRNAWVINEGKIDIDLEKAKVIHRKLIVCKGFDRVPKNEFGEQDFSVLRDELDLLDIAAATSLDQLYNIWPSSINNRTENRVYSEQKDDTAT